MFTRQLQSGCPDWPLYPELGRNSSDRPDGELSITAIAAASCVPRNSWPRRRRIGSSRRPGPPSPRAAR